MSDLYYEHLADQMADWENLQSHGDDPDVYNALNKKFTADMRDSFDDKEEADLVSSVAMSPYKGVTTVNEFLERAPTPEAPRETDSAFGFAIDKFQKNLGQGVRTIGDLFDSETLRDFGAGIVEQQLKDIEEGGYQSKYNKNFADTISEDGVFGAIGWVAEKAAENWADIGFSIAGGGAGVLARGALKGAVRTAASRGITTGTVAGAGLLGIGEVREELQEQGLYDPNDALLATGAGLLIGTLDAVIGKGVWNPAALGELIKNGTARAIGEAALSSGAGFAKEGVTEALQELAVIGTAALDGGEYEFSEVVNRLIDAGIVGGTFGGVAGGTGSIGQRIFEGGIQNGTPVVDGDVAPDAEPDVEIEQVDDVDAAPDVGVEGDTQPATEPDVDTTQPTAAAEPDAAIEFDDTPITDAQRDQTIVDKMLGAIRSSGTADIDLTALSSALSEAQTSYKTNQYKQSIYVDYQHLAEDAENYQQLVDVISTTAQQEIAAKLDELGIEVVVGGERSDLDDVHSDLLGRKKIYVQEMPRRGLLRNKVPEQSYTHAEALQAIKKAYGYVGTGARFDEAGASVADNAVLNLFSEQARPLIGSELVNPSTQFLLPKVLKQTERIQPRTDDLPEFAKRPGEARGDTPLRRYFDKTRAESGFVADVLDPAIEKLRPRAETDLRPSKLGDILKYKVFAKQDRNTADYFRLIEGKKSAVDREIKTMMKSVSSASKKLSKDTRFQGLNLDDSLDNVFNQILDGTIELVTESPGQMPRPDNVLRSGDDVVLRYSNGEIRYLPEEYLDGVLSANQLKHLETGYLLGELQQEVADLRVALNDTRTAISSLLTEAQPGVPISELKFARFSDSKNVRNEWAKVTGKASYVDALVDGVIEDIADARYNNVKKNLAFREELRELYSDGMENATDLNDFVTRTDGHFGDADNLNLAVVAALGGFENRPQRLQALKALEQEIKYQNKLTSELEFTELIANNTYYVGRVYSGHVDPTGDWLRGMENPTTKAELARRKAYKQELIDRAAEDAGDDFDIDKAKIDAESTIKELVDDVRAYRDGTVSGASDYPVAASLKRGDLGPAQREFLGELTDPAERMAYTVERIQNLRLHKARVNGMWRMLENDGMWRSKEDALAAGVDERNLVETQVSNRFTVPERGADRSDLSLAPTKVTVWVTKEVQQAIEQFQHIRPPSSIAGRALAGFNAEYRMWHTVYSYPLAAMNALSSMSTMVMAGYPTTWFSSEQDVSLTRSTKTLWEALTGKEITDAAGKEALFAVIGGEARYKEIVANEKLALDVVGRSISSLTGAFRSDVAQDIKGGAQAVWNGYVKVGENLYRAGDLAQKMIIYETTKAQLKSRFGDKLTERDAKDMARTRAIDVGFDSSQLPQFVDWIRQYTPLGGGFLSFDTLMHSITYKNLKWIKMVHNLEAVAYGMDNIDGFDPNNPEHMSAAHRGMPLTERRYSTQQAGSMIAGFMAHLAVNPMVWLLGMGLGMLSDDEDDENVNLSKEAMRQLLPDYYKNADIAFAGATDDGRINWVDTGRLSNQGKYWEGINALFRADPNTPVHQAALDSLGAIFGGYWNESFGVSAGRQLLNNETRFGQRIFNVDGSTIDMATDIAQFIANDVGGTSTIGAAIKGATSLWREEEYNKITGHDKPLSHSLLEYAGLRIKSFDPSHSLGGAMWAEQRRLSDAKQYYRNKLRNFNELPEEEIKTHMLALKGIMRDVYASAQDKVAAARELGLDDDQIDTALKKKFGKDVRKALVNGTPAPLSIGKFGQSSTESQQIRRIEQEAKDSFGHNYKLAVEIFNNL